MSRWVRAWWPAAAWMLLILTATTVPAAGGWASLPEGADKVVHVLLYAGLGWTIAVGLSRMGVQSRSAWLAGMAVGAAFAAADEAHQIWVPGRDAAIGDWLADVAGLGAGILARAVGLRRDGGLTDVTDVDEARRPPPLRPEEPG